MKKLCLILFFSLQLSAFDTQTASKIFEKIFTAINIDSPIKVYTVDAKYKEVIGSADSLQLVERRDLADIILVISKRAVPKYTQKIIFTTSPSVFEKNENAIGAFYWEHGRPKIIFLQSRLQRHNIELSSTFEKYIVKELQ